MEKFNRITSRAIPLPLKDVDTDMIIPAQFLTSISRDGYGQNLFRRLRDADPDFAFNQERFAGASILVTGSNFGCGSSREHAVWALSGAGIKVIIAKSFADIFYSNCAKNGLLLVVLPDTVVDRLLEAAEQSDLQLTVNLDNQTVCQSNGESFEFQYDPFRKHCLLNGLDDIDYILSMQEEIMAFRSKQSAERFAAMAQV